MKSRYTANVSIAKERADLLFAMASEHRLNIIALLTAHRELRVRDLKDRLPHIHQHICFHLNILKKAKVVNTRKQAQMTYYSLASDSCNKLLSAVEGISAGLDIASTLEENGIHT